jgi:hypothetical protein
MTIRDWNFALESPKVGEEAYVGLREKADRITLRVPHGYPEGADVEDKHQILGELTRAVMRFSETFANVKRSTRDGWLKAEGGQSFNFDSNGPSLGYTHNSRYLQLIRMLRDPRLLAITKASGLTAQFDHRYISRNLERAMFLQDGTPVFDLSWAPRTQMRHTGNDMVGLACWMALDAVKILFPNSADHQIAASLQSEWEELAYRFADEHELDANASLFSVKRKNTLSLLQTALETCVRLSPPVSSDARELHHLLDELLHYALSGQDGDIWGLQGFYHVWESACLEHAIAKYGIDNIFTCDDKYLPDIDQSRRDTWKGNQHRVFAKNGIARRPDLVVGPVVKNEDGTYRYYKEGFYLIVDFKYYAEAESEIFVGRKRPSVLEPPLLPTGEDWTTFKRDYSVFRHSYKAAQDIASIEAYRWLLMQHQLNAFDESNVELELWVPGEEHDPGEKDKEELLCWRVRGWNDKLLNDTTKFNKLTMVYKPARAILGAYAKEFLLMG